MDAFITLKQIFKRFFLNIVLKEVMIYKFRTKLNSKVKKKKNKMNVEISVIMHRKVG